MIMTTDTIESALRGLGRLPTPVKSWRVEAGPDATDDSAVWVWATLADENSGKQERAELREMVRETVRRSLGPSAGWVYVRFRTASEVPGA